jgi:hypothetical protein
MKAPTFVNSYSTSWITTTTPKTVSVTTQAGDIVVVYGGIENGGGGIMGTPTGNNIVFTLQQSIHITVAWADAYLWTGIDRVGGTNWTLSNSLVGSLEWGYDCLVFRDSTGIGVSAKTNVNSGAPSLGLTTTMDNSAVVMFNIDWSAQDGATRTWRTVNGITPSAGNSLERDYARSAAAHTIYGGYYNDAGTAGAKTVGISAPGSQIYSIVAVEVLGTIPVNLAWTSA